MDSVALYRTVWRWHFYAGLFVVPMVLILALSGSLYLFRPEVERWEERAFQHLPTSGAVMPDAQVAAALATYPGARLQAYRIPERDGDAAMVHLALPGHGGRPGAAMRDVFVSPQGQVLGALDPESRIMAVVQRLHGQLLLGPRGSWLVELAASWAIVMIATGLYLWWPRGRGPAGVVWPRLNRGAGAVWRDLHAVTGFWVAGLALVLLLTGLPWAGVWGSTFKAVRAELGWVKGRQDWTIAGQVPDGADPAGSGRQGSDHAEHDHAAMLTGMDHGPGRGLPAMAGMRHVTLSRIVALARSEHLPFPVLVTPPGAPGRFGRGGGPDWVVRSETPNRPLRVTLVYDGMTGQPGRRETFADAHPIDRAIGYGVAWHEGQLLGWANRLIGLATALMLVILAVSGFVLWRRRRPASGLGAPPPARRGREGYTVLLIVCGAALVLPLLAASLVAVAVFDRLVLPRLPALARWLGAALLGRG